MSNVLFYVKTSSQSIRLIRRGQCGELPVSSLNFIAQSRSLEAQLRRPRPRTAHPAAGSTVFNFGTCPGAVLVHHYAQSKGFDSSVVCAPHANAHKSRSIVSTRVHDTAPRQSRQWPGSQGPSRWSRGFATSIFPSAARCRAALMSIVAEGVKPQRVIPSGVDPAR